MIEFADAMRDAGIDPPLELVADGIMHRFRQGDDRRDKRNGWSVLHLDPPAGAFGCWKRGISEKWSPAKEYSEEERAEFRRKVEAERKKRMEREAKEKEVCRQKAVAIWGRAKQVEAHPYLEKKGVKAHGARVYGETLVLTVADSAKVIHGLQFIGGDGVKKFLTGTAKAGCYFSIGKPSGVVCVAEGFATGASIHECTGYAVAVAFDAGNLALVAKAIRQKFPVAKIIICADNDASGVGAEKGKAAADACDGFFRMAPSVGMDFNDLHQQRGVDAVREIICK
jgi:putative DNA primase/helicase